MRKGAALWVLGLLATLGVTSCSIPSDGEPSTLVTPNDVFAVGVAPSDPAPRSGQTTNHPVYFLRENRLVRVDRSLPAPVVLDGPLNSLLAGPTTEEATAGLQSAIPAGTEVTNVQIQRDNVVWIHLNSVFFEVEGTQRVRATAQMVFTGAALLRGSQGVQFLLNDEIQSLPDGTGAIAEPPPGEQPRPLRTTDFAQLEVPGPAAPEPVL